MKAIEQYFCVVLSSILAVQGGSNLPESVYELPIKCDHSNTSY